MNSILDSIKKLLMISDEITAFDADIIIHINSAFMVLHQLGLGPSGGFSITGNAETWDEFTSEDSLEAVKTFVYLWVRKQFDPPDSSIKMEAINSTLDELTWRLNVAADPEVW